MARSWADINAKLDRFLDDALRTDAAGDPRDRLFPVPLRVDAWNWAQGVLVHHTPLAKSMTLVVNTSQREAALPDDIAARWTALVQARDAAETRYQRATTGPYNAAMTADDIADAIEAAKAHRATIATKIARTRKEAGNPLAPILAQNDDYLRRKNALARDKRNAELALHHLSIAAGDEPPF